MNFLSILQFSPPAGKADEAGDPDTANFAMSDMQIVEAFSLISVPDDILRSSNVPEMVNEMRSAQKSMESSAKELSLLRSQKEDGNFISNWWNDRNEKIKDAQFDLNHAIGALTSHSSNLLIVNTAMAKILNGQQGILQKQQIALKSQANDIEEQNEKIKAQQEILENNQREINKANQGLLEAKGLTQAQAQQLVGCVEKVTSSEKKILEAHGRLIGDVEERLSQTANDCSDMVSSRLLQFDDAHMAVAKRVDERLALSDAGTLGKFAEVEAQRQELDRKIESMVSREAQISAMLEKQRKEMRMHRIVHALGGVATLALFIWMTLVQFAIPH